MRIVSPLVFAMLLASIGSAQEMPSVPATVAALVPATGPAIVTARFAADEAKQGVAVDARYFYPMSNNRIGKYDMKTGKRVAQWKGSRALYPHMNSCMVDGEDLVCAASNYPAVPMSSAVEVFDTRTLRHLRSISLPPMQGSLTWIERHDGAWFAGYANYPEARGGEPGHDHRWTLLVRFDAQFRSTGSWHFPDSVLARFAPMSTVITAPVTGSPRKVSASAFRLASTTADRSSAVKTVAPIFTVCRVPM